MRLVAVLVTVNFVGMRTAAVRVRLPATFAWYSTNVTALLQTSADAASTANLT